MRDSVGVDRAYSCLCEVKDLHNSLFRDWVDYRDGFGDFKLWNDEFWLGNEHMYSLLSEGQKWLKSVLFFKMVFSYSRLSKLSGWLAAFLSFVAYISLP